MFKQYTFLKLFSLCFVLMSFSVDTYSKENEIKIDSINAQLVTSIDTDTLSFEGNVVIKTQLIEFWSDKAVFNKNNKSLSLEGSVKALSKNLDINAQRLEANLSDRTFYMTESTFSFMDKTFGEAKALKIYTNEKVELLNTSINNCSQEDPLWQVNAEKITLLETGKNAVIRGLSLEIQNTPLIYIPYFRTALGKEKFSGFLPPSLKQGKDGLDISIPYFLNLAPNYDLTLSPRFIEERGTGFSTEFRYLSPKSSGSINASNLFKDRKFRDKTNYHGNRWMAQWLNKSQFGNNLFIDIQAEDISDDFYFEDLNRDILGTSQKNFLTKKFKARWLSKSVSLEAEIREVNNLNPFSSEEYETKPKINLNVHKKINNLNFELFSNFTKFEFENDINPFNKEEQIKRTLVEPSLTYKRHFPNSSFMMGSGSKKLKYESTSESHDSSSLWFESEYKIHFEKQTKDFYKSLNPTIKFIQLEEKTPYISSIDSRLMGLDFNNLFRKNWYSGPDKFLNQDRIILGVEHSIFNKETGSKLFFSLGKAYFLDDEYIVNDRDLRSSPVIMEYRYALSRSLYSSSIMEMHPDLNKVISGSFSLIYQGEEDKSFELRSIYQNEKYPINKIPWKDAGLPISQVEILYQWPLVNNFSIFGKARKDLKINKSNDLLYGFQYSSCCMKFGLMKRKWIDQDYYPWYSNPSKAFADLSEGVVPQRSRNNLYVFFELKDLGRIGKEISKVISSTRLE